MTDLTIPHNSVELEEMLNDPKTLSKIFSDKAATKEFLHNYAVSQLTANDGELSTLIKESAQVALAEMLKTDKKNLGKIDFSSLSDTTPPNGKTSAVRNAAYNSKLATAKLDGLYDGLGSLALDVQKFKKGRPVSNSEAWDKICKVTNAYSETDPATGGFLVPEEMRSTLLQMALEQSIMRSRATVITMSSLTTSIPYVDETTHVGSVFGGMQFTWVGESASITPTEAKFGRVKLEANKLVGGARVPNELWADASALSTWLETAAPMGLAFHEDIAAINGSGNAQPLGIRNSGAKITYTRATTDMIAASDLYGMFARMLPQSLGNAIWLVNQTALPQLFAVETSAGEFPLGIINIRDTPFMSILGRPMIVTEKIPALAGGSGDEIMFVDPKFYLFGDRQAVSLDFSEHSRFMNDETELRIIERVDGRPWVQSPLTPLNGSTVSPIVGISASQ